METDLERGETPQIILHFVGRQFRTGDKQAALSDLALVFHQRTAAGIRMLGFEPDERLSAKRRCEKSIIRAHSGEAVDPGSPQHANGNSERELCAVNAAAQAGADGHVKKLQSQRARKNVPQPWGPGELPQPPSGVRLR